MKSRIIKKHYQSKRNPEVSQTVYLKGFYGGEYITGDWTEDETEAYVFDRKSHAKAICKGLKLYGLSLVDKPQLMLTVAYIKKELGNSIRHCPKKLKKAATLTARENGLEPISIFRLACFNEPLEGSHSYGFHTRFGRHLIESFADNYYSMD